MSTFILAISISLIAVLATAAVLYISFVPTPQSTGSTVRDLLLEEEGPRARGARAGSNVQELENLDIEKIKKLTKRHVDMPGKRETVGSRLFKAGYYSDSSRAWFRTFQIVSVIGFTVFVPALFAYIDFDGVFMFLGMLAGAIVGVIFPIALLDRKVERRREEIRYYLPLVTEQISIGVSSSLIVGSSIQQVIDMAHDRDGHNAVTEMLVHVDKLMKSGIGFEEAMLEVAEISGMSEVQHAFMFLVQCSRHGGEISKQLQGLSDAIMTERNVMIQGRIAALPVKATGPLGLVFAGFYGMLIAGILVNMMMSL